MMIKVRLGDQVYDVEVGDLQARPVIATVEGQRFEVWPEEEISAPAAPPAPQAPTAAPRIAAPPLVQPASPQAAAPSTSEAVCAPIPGVITSISVQPGSDVTRGQELCALEAMKMNNLIRAPKAGKIAAVKAAVGQHVKHGDVLLEYESS